ncbi:hypothetical protein [Yoonia sp. BS5-3]|uniref:Outer membrane protein beta-barrel domain-containing protein n=1 Tax=Yoonia phaeophyticola TaxID=3137369 RepID=A0ABZ2V7Q5_9RHOB
MKSLFPAILAASLGTGAMAQDLYLGGSLDYMFPHSGDAQTAGSIIGGFGVSSGPFALTAEAEYGVQVAGENDYDTARVRMLASYDWLGYSFHAGGGVTEYYFSDDTSGGFNFGFGAERAVTDTLTVRGELIRDIMDNTFTAAVTTTRVGLFYDF